MKEKIKLDTERMREQGPYSYDVFKINYLYGLNDLCEKYVKQDHTILELGSNDGVSAQLFSFFCKKVVCVDMLQTPSMTKLLMDSDNIDFYHMSFDEFHTLDQGNTYDLIYIDGCHDYDSVYNDIEKFKNKVKTNGALCGHDYNPTTKVELAVKKHFPNHTIEIFSDSSWLVIL